MTTAGLLREVSAETIARLIARHHCGDWGQLEPEDRQANEHALVAGERVLSSYWVDSHKDPGVELHVYVITEADRSATTALLASEY